MTFFRVKYEQRRIFSYFYTKLIPAIQGLIKIKIQSMRFFSLFLALAFVTTLSAQTVHKDCWDGVMYMKIKNESNHLFEDLEDVLTNHRFREVKELAEKYEFTEIERQFIFLKTPIFDRTYTIKFNQIEKVYDLIRDFEELDFVEYAEQKPIDRKTIVPNDPRVGEQWHLDKISAYLAHDIHTGGATGTVAIVDDAVDVFHEDLQPNRWVNPNEIPGNLQDDDGNGKVDDVFGWDVANNNASPAPPSTNPSLSHGTHVAGCAAAATNNSLGVASVGHSVKIIGVKATYDSETDPVVNQGYLGVAYAASVYADVINMSWGGTFYSITNQNVINQAHANDCLLIAAAGNDGQDIAQFPAQYENVVAVASTTFTDAKSNFSNFGEWIDIAAPGSDILATRPFDNYGYASGTSMASPVTAGVCALMRSFNEVLTNDQIEQCLKATADDISLFNPAYNGKLGAGRVNAQQALFCVSPSTAPLLGMGTNVSSACPGEPIQVFDESFFGPTSWNWSFPGGNPSSSNMANPIVTYNSPGTYNVTLTASNDFGTSTETFNGAIVVDENLEVLNFIHDFDDNSASWTVDNPDGGISWQFRVVDAGVDDNSFGAYYMNHWDYTDIGQRDGLISPKVDLYGVVSATLNVEYAYRARPLADNDSLIVYVSTDGGNTFPHRVFADAENGSFNFATFSLLNGAFIPQNIDEWCTGTLVPSSCLEIDISAFAGLDDVRFKLETYNNNGNNLFIDNVYVNTSCISSSATPIADFETGTFLGCGTTFEADFYDNSIGVIDTWSWSFPGGTPSTSNERNPVITYNSPGVYDVELVVTNSAGTSTKSLTAAVGLHNDEPTADFSFVQSWAFVEFTSLSTDVYSYTWDFGDGNTSYEANPTHNYASLDTNYEVKLKVENGCGVDSITYSILTTSTDEPFEDGANASVFPNPNNGQFQITFDGMAGEEIIIRVYDILGRTIHAENILVTNSGFNYSVDLDNNPTGTLILELGRGEERIFRKLLVK